MRRYALRDDQWDRIKDVLPGREGHVGGTAADNRLFVEAVLYNIEPAFPGVIFPSVSRLEHRLPTLQSLGEEWVFERIFKLLASDHDNEYMMIDATIVRAHSIARAREKKRRASHRPLPRRTDH